MDSSSGNEESSVVEEPKVTLTEMGKGSLEAGAGDASTSHPKSRKCLKKLKDDDSRSDKDGSLAEDQDQMQARRDVGLSDSGDFVKLCWGKIKLFCLNFLEFVFKYTNLRYWWRDALPPGPESPKVTLLGMEDEDPGADPGDKSARGPKSVHYVDGQFLTESTDNLGNDIAEEDTDNLDAAQLIQSRKEALKQKQMARRVEWLEQVKEELAKQTEYKRTMEGIPPNQVEDKDKQRMSNTSREWRKTFRKQRTRFLFNEVFPILCKHAFKPCLTCTNCLRHNPILSFVLGSRLVCSSWKEVIDCRLGSHNTSASAYSGGLPDCGPILVTLDQLISFNLWSQHTYHGRNPFFARQFTAGSRSAGEWRNNLGYWNEVEKMLRRWGGEVWSLNLMFDKGSLEMMYILLCRVLRLTPNLQRLNLMDRESYAILPVGSQRELRKEEWGPLKLRMERSPLPELPNLRSIVFGDGACAPVPLLQAMLEKYGDSLRSLYFLGMGDDIFTGSYMDPGEFLAGRLLSLQKYSCQYWNTPQISHWKYQFPSLNELRLEYINVEEGAEVRNIFKTANSCASTLRYLRLGFNFKGSAPEDPSKWRDCVPPGLKLTLPHLEILDLTVIMSKITGIDFLLPLISLKELIFSYDVMKGDNSVKNGKGIIQFAGFRNRLYDSNIWKLLPELRMATIKIVPIAEQGTKRDRFGRQIQQPKNITVYNRDGYQKHLI